MTPYIPPTNQVRATAIAYVIASVAKYAGIPPEELISKDRHRTIALARQVAMYVCRCHIQPEPSYPELGRCFGNRDHTTVMAAVRRIELRRGTDPWIERAIEAARLGIPKAQVDAAQREGDQARADMLAKCRMRESLLRQAAEIETEIGAMIPELEVAKPVSLALVVGGAGGAE